MAVLIFEKPLDKSDKKEWKISNGASKLPSGNAKLNVKDASTGEVMFFEYSVSGRSTPVIQGKDWRRFVARCFKKGDSIIITLYKNDGSYIIEAK